MSKKNIRLADRLKGEREKIKEISGTGKKIEYIWDYYKLWIIGIVFFIWFKMVPSNVTSLIISPPP